MAQRDSEGIWAENHENRADNFRPFPVASLRFVTDRRFFGESPKRFTRGAIVTHFSNLDEARKWIFGDALDVKNEPPALVMLKETVGTSVFQLSPSQLGEAVGAFKECEVAGITLTEAVRFAIRHAKPPAGTISATRAIELALREKEKGKRPSYITDLGSRSHKRSERRHQLLGSPSARHRQYHEVRSVIPEGGETVLEFEPPRMHN
jgi:hypothetical protein